MADIKIEIKGNWEGRRVGQIQQEGSEPGLMLIYPRISATATVSCQD